MIWWVPVIQARPRIDGIIATLSPTRVSLTMLQSKRESMIDLPIKRSPVFINPFACNTAMRAEHPVPVGERSSLPGSIETVFLLTLAHFLRLLVA